MKSGYPRYMLCASLRNLAVMLCLLFAAAISLVQPVYVSATHIEHEAQVSSAIVNHDHLHQADLLKHDPADHAHDAAHHTALVVLPVMTRLGLWTRHGTHDAVSTDPGAHDRPPRSTVAT